MKKLINSIVLLSLSLCVACGSGSPCDSSEVKEKLIEIAKAQLKPAFDNSTIEKGKYKLSSIKTEKIDSSKTNCLCTAKMDIKVGKEKDTVGILYGVSIEDGKTHVIPIDAGSVR